MLTLQRNYLQASSVLAETAGVVIVAAELAAKELVMTVAVAPRISY